MRIAVSTTYDTRLRAGGGAVIVRYLIEALQRHDIEVVLWLCQDNQSKTSPSVKFSQTSERYQDWEFTGFPPQIAFSLQHFAAKDFQKLCQQAQTLQTQKPIDGLLIFNALTPGLWPMELAQALNIPYILTLLDYSFICPIFTRINQSGNFCQGEISESTCLTCTVAHLPAEKRPIFRLLRLLPHSVRSIMGKKFPPLFPAHTRYHAGSLNDRLMRREDMKGLFEQASAVVYQSSIMQKQFHLAEWQHSQEHIECYGVPQATSRVKLVTPFDSVIQFVYLSRPTKEWGIEFLLDTWRQYCGDKSDRHLTILSPGIEPLSQKHPEWKDLGNVTFSGEMIQGRVAEFHAQFHVLILPAQWQGIVALTALEALAHGTAVIEPDLGGLPTYGGEKPEQMGIAVYQWRNSNGLAECIDDLCQNRTKLQSLMENAKLIRSLNQWGNFYFNLFEKSIYQGKNYD